MLFVNLAIVLPLIVLFFVLLVSVSANASASNNRTNLQVLIDRAEAVLSTNTEVIKMIATFTIDRDIHRMLSMQEYSDYELVRYRADISVRCVELTSMYNTGWYQILVFGENEENFFESSVAVEEGAISLEELKMEAWYQELEKSAGKVTFFPAYQSEILSEHLPDKAVFATTILKNSNSAREIALVVVAMSREMFVDDLLQFDTAVDNSVMTDREGNIIFASDPKIYDLNINFKEDYSEIFREESGFFTTDVAGVNSNILFATVDDTEWKIISYGNVSYIWTDYIYITVLLGLLLLFVIVVMVRYNSNYIHRKILGINKHILTVTSGDLKARLHEEEYESEFHELGRNFNDMLDALQSLIDKLHEEEQKKYALEFQTLQAQINPHFLYNTLATIRFMVQMEQYADADRAMVTFSKLLRRSFKDNRSLIMVEEELSLVGDYMNLMQIRHQNAFNYEIDIAPDVKDCGILKNTIQPLVENSISHGFNTKSSLGHISIKAMRQGQCVRIEVEDDGENADIERIKERLDTDIMEGRETRFAGIGLANVQQRFRYNFGNDYGLMVEKNGMGGITFVVTFPIVEAQEQTQ